MYKYQQKYIKYKTKYDRSITELTDKEQYGGGTKKGITWQKNSCYIDSVFMALFFNPSQTVKDKILNKNVDDLNKPYGNCDYKTIHEQILGLYNYIQKQSKHIIPKFIFIKEKRFDQIY